MFSVFDVQDSYLIYIASQGISGKSTHSWKTFGIPLIARLPDPVCGLDVQNLYLKLLSPFELPKDAMEDMDIPETTACEDTMEEEKTVNPDMDGSDNSCIVNEISAPSDPKLQFYLADEKGTTRESEITMNEPVLVKGMSRKLNVLVCWPEKIVEEYDTCLLSRLPEVFKSVLFSKRPQESVSLYKCLEAFLKEEPLGPDDMWLVLEFFC